MNHVSSHYNSPLFVRPVRTWFTLSHKYVSDVICRKKKNKKNKSIAPKLQPMMSYNIRGGCIRLWQEFRFKSPMTSAVKRTRWSCSLPLSLSLFSGGKDVAIYAQGPWAERHEVKTMPQPLDEYIYQLANCWIQCWMQVCVFWQRN